MTLYKYAYTAGLQSLPVHKRIALCYVLLKQGLNEFLTASTLYISKSKTGNNIDSSFIYLLNLMVPTILYKLYSYFLSVA